MYTWNGFLMDVIRIFFVRRSISLSLPAESSHSTGFIYFTYMISCDLCFYACFLFLFFLGFLIPTYQSLLVQERPLSVLENWDGYLFVLVVRNFFFEIRIFKNISARHVLYFLFYISEKIRRTGFCSSC